MPLGSGRRFAYSNTRYVLLAEVLAAVEGRDVPAVAHQELSAPQGMASTRLGGPPAVVLPGLPQPPGTVGDGGLWTTAADLLTWLVALNQQRWGQQLAALISTPGHLRDGTVLDYAWGVRVRALPAGRWITRGGNWPGWAAMTVRIPEQQVAVAVVHCGDAVQAVSDVAEALARALITA